MRRAELDVHVLRALLDESSEGVLLLDEHGVVVDANAAAAIRLGRSRQYLRGKPLAALVPLDHRKSFRHAFDKVIGGETARLELPLGGAKGSTQVAMRVLPHLGARAISVRLLGRLSLDMTPPPRRSELRLELDRIFRRFPSGVIGIWREDLRIAFVNPRAHQLLPGQTLVVGAPLRREGFPADLGAVAERLVVRKVPMRATRVELDDGRALRVTGVPAFGGEPALLLLEDVTDQERHARVMSEFLRNAAHQLRTPLTAITTAVQVLQSGAKNEPTQRDHFLAHVEQHVERMTRLTRGLLVLARAQSREQAIRLDFVELRPLLDRLAERADAPDGVTVETDCAPSLAIFAEPDLVEEALAALLDNALASTREGTVRLTAAEENGRAFIQVADSGRGVLPEHRERIFEPFFRVANDGNGFGLGLAIASQAVQAMGGELEVADASEGGTIFAVRLPSARIDR